ncbi:MAG: cell division protein FtsA [Candidatus Dependentiae bacterium]|nr:cell division protein FtsA [Candidatus Dependentiae bacterium]
MAKVFHSLITSIDVGTTKISVLIAQKTSDDTVEILGIGKSPSDGLDKGVVVDVARTVQSIKRAVKEAELMAGCSISEAYVGISGSHIHSFNTHGAVPIKRSQVLPSDIQAVLTVAQAVPIEEGQKVLHALPQYFMVDGKDRVVNPLGLHGVRLEAVVHVITGAVFSIQNLMKCCELAGVTVKDIVLEQLASAEGVLSPDERALGVGVLDIGGGTSDFAIYQQSSIRYTKVFPLAGNYFTKDLAVGLRATLHDAERFKREHGFVGYMQQEHDEELEIESVQGNSVHKVSKQQAGYILHARALELFMLLQDDIKRSSLASMMTAGLVITGGGSLLVGIDDLAKKMLGMPVRIGRPRVDCGFSEILNNPTHATGYGLLKYALRKDKQVGMNQMEGPMAQRVFTKMRSWVDKFF